MKIFGVTVRLALTLYQMNRRFVSLVYFHFDVVTVSKPPSSGIRVILSLHPEPYLTSEYVNEVNLDSIPDSVM